MACDINLALRVMECPITSVRCLTLLAGVGEAYLTNILEPYNGGAGCISILSLSPKTFKNFIQSTVDLEFRLSLKSDLQVAPIKLDEISYIKYT